MDDPADGSKHAGIGSDGLDEVDVEFGGGEGLACGQRAEHGEAHRAVGERGERAAVDDVVRIVELAGRRHFECCAAIGYGDEAHAEEADVGGRRRSTAQGGLEQVTTGHLRRVGHRPHCIAA